MRLNLKQAINLIEREVLFIDLAAVVWLDILVKSLVKKFRFIHFYQAAINRIKQLGIALR